MVKRSKIQVISRDKSYTPQEFRLRTGIGDTVWRTLRHHIVRQMGGKHFVLGADWLAYLEQQVELGSPEQREKDSEA